MPEGLNQNFQSRPKTPGDLQVLERSFSQEDRIYLSQRFLDILKEQKIVLAQNSEFSRGLSTAEASRNLELFKLALRHLIKDSRFPAVERIGMKASLFDLSPESASTVDGVDLYPHSVRSILYILNRVLMPEVSSQIHTYAESIFHPLIEDYKKHANNI